MEKYKQHSVITRLDRREIEFLDKLGKDSLFTQGHKLTYSEILRAAVNFAMDIGLSASGVSSTEDLKKKLYCICGKRDDKARVDLQEERRLFIRLKNQMSVQYRILESLGPHNEIKTEDLSSGGIKVILPEPLAIETRLELSIKANETQESFLMYGRVVWSKPVEGLDGYQTGIQLFPANNESRERFYAYLSQNIPKQT